MRRAVRIAVVVVVSTTALGLAATAATAQRTPPTTAPRTTVPTVSPRAGSFPVLQTADLPAGYRMGTGSPFEVTNRSPIYPSIDDCLWDFENPFSGLTPDIYQSSFMQTALVSGLSITIVFDGAKPAMAFYDNFEKAYRSAAKCTTTKAPSSTSSTPVGYGTIEMLEVGKPGDSSFGAVITPSSAVFPEIKYAVFRDGRSVVQLRIADDDMSVKDFKTLTRIAEKRAA